MVKCLTAMYQKDYHNREVIIIKIVEQFRRSYCQVAVMSLLGTLTTELLKVVYDESFKWTPLTDDVKFSNLIKFLDERLFNE